MLIDTAVLYSLIPVGMTLTLTEGFRLVMKLEHEVMSNHLIIKWLEVARGFGMVDYIGEMTAKKSCKYSEYESFEH